MTGRADAFTIHQTEKRQIAEAGGVGVFATRYNIRKAIQTGAGLMRISYQALLSLPSRTETDYVSVREAAEETGMSESKLRELCREHRIKSRKDGKRWLILWKSLEEYLEAEEERARQPSG